MKFLVVESPPFFDEFYHERGLKIGNTEGMWADFPISEYPGNDPRLKPTKVDVKHCLLWEDNGVCYRLWRINTDVTEEKAINIAKAIIDKTCPQNDKFKFEGKKYNNSDISNDEIKKQTGLQVKIPNQLKPHFSLEYKTVSAITQRGETIHVVDAYYINDNRHLKVSITPVSGTISYMKTLPGSKIMMIGNTECFWIEAKDVDGSVRVNFMGWSSDEMDYLVGFLEGNFVSQEEAFQVATSVLK